jgi:isoleucyl-tRNA synthetase
LYANVDNFNYSEAEIPVSERPEIDKWIISLLNTLIKDVEMYYETYEPTRAGRAIQEFVTENLSNWYVRLNRKRFWGDKYNNDKIAAYQTLYFCLEVVAKLMSPIAPFYADQLFIDLNKSSKRHDYCSVHISKFPVSNPALIDKDLEERMEIAQQLSSMILALRRKVSIKVRQPLQKMMIPILEQSMADKINAIKEIVLAEVNVKEIEFIDNNNNVLVKKVKPDFKALGQKLGKNMKLVAAKITSLSQLEISELEQNEKLSLKFDDFETEVLLSEVEIISEDIPGWLVANEGKLTVALDVTVTEELKEEGIAREIINRVQNLRKESGFEVVDKIKLSIQNHADFNTAVNNFKSYIGAQTLAVDVKIDENLKSDTSKTIEINDVEILIKIEKV